MTDKAATISLRNSLRASSMPAIWSSEAPRAPVKFHRFPLAAKSEAARLVYRRQHARNGDGAKVVNIAEPKPALLLR
jgi:hypothetical protein